MEAKVLSFDVSLLLNVVFVAANVFLLFSILSYYLFNPVREYMKKRNDRIKNDLETADKEKEQALEFKHKYEEKINNINKESDAILSTARKKALTRETEIINKAKEEANRLIDNAKVEINREKDKVKDEVKQEIVLLASQIAEKFVATSLNEKEQNKLIEETLSEMGEKTWLN